MDYQQVFAFNKILSLLIYIGSEKSHYGNWFPSTNPTSTEWLFEIVPRGSMNKIEI